jgi:crotonobetainyl-CoA:carnitine CoA-transferase CaiB-like acyl-CoA transferase
MIGDPQREPLRLGGYQTQYITGLSAFAGTMAALHRRYNTGRGQQVEISAHETIAFTEWKSGIYYQAGGQVRRRGGSVSQWMTLPCKDGYVAFVYLDKNWPAVVELIGDKRMTETRFSTLANRVKNREELRSILEAWTKLRPKLEIYHEAQAKGIPVGMVADMADLVASPQYAATAFLDKINHPSTGPVQYPGIPCTVDGERWSTDRAPLLGEDSMAIYQDRLGLATTDVLRLRETSVI